MWYSYFFQRIAVREYIAVYIEQLCSVKYNVFQISAVIESIGIYKVHIFIDMYDLYHLGTDAGHAGANFTTMSFSPSDVEKYYSQYENIVRALFSCFIEGENNG